ncbi:hypothetical protein R1sor_026854 [Riccia sorocarpa]|uniref:Uncharacterized protein n=1 Tax=Riccia sorocarpa TaxID=122646 RepID=A0ABD3GEA0_9MARC
MDNYQGVIPFIWKRIRQYRFRDTYQQMNKEYYYPRRRRQALIKSTSLGGRRSWGLKMPKLRISAASPGSSKRFEASDDDEDSYSVGYVNYMVKEGSLGAATSYAYSSKW